MQVESEIERRIELLNTLPVIKENGWRIHVSCEWLGQGPVKIVRIAIFAGRYHEKIMSVTRNADSVLEAVNKAFVYITDRLEKVYEARDTGQSGMAMDRVT